MARQRKYNGLFRKTFTYNGKRFYVYGNTAQELIMKEVQKREELEKGYQDLYNPTLNNYYDHLTDIRSRELKGSTLRSQKSQFKTLSQVEMTTGVMFGEMHIKDVTRRDIELVRQKLLQSGKTPQNLNIIFAHLNHVLECAVRDDTIVKNPCKALKPLKREAPLIKDTKHRALSVEETKKFFDVAEERHSYYLNDFLIMIKTGMRLGELSALYMTDIDRKNGFIHVRRTVSRTETNGYEISDSTKTNSGVRDIPLTNEVLDIIRSQQALNGALFGLKKNGLLFRSAEGDILRDYGVNREIKRICKVAEIEPFSSHAFRNTFATRFIEQRPQDYKILSEILGHKDVSITLNLYTHVMTENKVKAMNDIMIKTS